MLGRRFEKVLRVEKVDKEVLLIMKIISNND